MAVPALYDAEVRHVRRRALDRAFGHAVYLWLVDLDALPRLPAWLRPFARFEARDHLGDPARTIRENLDAWLATQGVDLAGGQVLMLANARLLGYVFNPITVYWCHRPDGELECVVAEVHNTYGERHCYLLHTDDAGRAETAKDFYVSPFLSVDGRYRMSLPLPGERLAIAVTLHQEGSTALTATVVGTRRPATPASLARMLLRRPLMTYRTSALIRRHGIALWLRRLPVIRRPQHTPQKGVQ
ncbi:DUF1365 domain-containing protein [Pseudonocardia sp.]|uniref:DUF1365 domain-containing protein n=1 Tax=Pseudonocardia sp. TaxID=60912 RepID=UPI0026191182|nr:DUF1365 domain-containing protein [Pseudonocardia sp.]